MHKVRWRLRTEKFNRQRSPNIAENREHGSVEIWIDHAKRPAGAANDVPDMHVGVMLRSLRKEQFADGLVCRNQTEPVNAPSNPLQAGVELVGHLSAGQFLANDVGDTGLVFLPQGFVGLVDPGPVSRPAKLVGVVFPIVEPPVDCQACRIDDTRYLMAVNLEEAGQNDPPWIEFTSGTVFTRNLHFSTPEFSST